MANPSAYLIGGVGALALVGITAWSVMPTDSNDSKTETLVPASIVEAKPDTSGTTVVVETNEITLEPTAEQRDFQTMAVDGREETCVAPRPPVDLASKAYIRNAYAAILEIMAVERQQQEDNCRCYLAEIPWTEVVAESKRFETTDTAIPPFNLAELRATAEALATEQKAACSN